MKAKSNHISGAVTEHITWSNFVECPQSFDRAATTKPLAISNFQFENAPRGELTYYAADFSEGGVVDVH